MIKIQNQVNIFTGDSDPIKNFPSRFSGFEKNMDPDPARVIVYRSGSRKPDPYVRENNTCTTIKTRYLVSSDKLSSSRSENAFSTID